MYSKVNSRNYLIGWIMLALIAWGILHAIGAYLFDLSGWGVLRAVIVLAVMMAFLGFWWIALLSRRNPRGPKNRSRMKPKDVDELTF